MHFYVPLALRSKKSAEQTSSTFSSPQTSPIRAINIHKMATSQIPISPPAPQTIKVHTPDTITPPTKPQRDPTPYLMPEPILKNEVRKRRNHNDPMRDYLKSEARRLAKTQGHKLCPNGWRNPAMSGCLANPFDDDTDSMSGIISHAMDKEKRRNREWSPEEYAPDRCFNQRCKKQKRALKEIQENCEREKREGTVEEGDVTSRLRGISVDRFVLSHKSPSVSDDGYGCDLPNCEEDLSDESTWAPSKPRDDAVHVVEKLWDAEEAQSRIAKKMGAWAGQVDDSCWGWYVKGMGSEEKKYPVKSGSTDVTIVEASDTDSEKKCSPSNKGSKWSQVSSKLVSELGALKRMCIGL